MWAGADKGRTETSYEVDDAKSLVDEWKDKHLEAIVERVLNGDRLVPPAFIARGTFADGRCCCGSSVPGRETGQC
jgi:hypothetical protein